MKNSIEVIKLNIKGLQHLWDLDKSYVILSFVWPVIFMPVKLYEVYTIKYITDGLVYGKAFSNLLLVILSLGVMKLARNFLGNCYNKKYQFMHRERLEQN